MPTTMINPIDALVVFALDVLDTIDRNEILPDAGGFHNVLIDEDDVKVARVARIGFGKC